MANLSVRERIEQFGNEAKFEMCEMDDIKKYYFEEEKARLIIRDSKSNFKRLVCHLWQPPTGLPQPPRSK